LVSSSPKPNRWCGTKLEDLKGKKIGIVQDYGNTPEFMALAKNGTIKTEVVTSDLLNIKKVAGGRIDGAFIDLANLNYFLKYDAKDLAGQVQANPGSLTRKILCWRSTTALSTRRRTPFCPAALPRSMPTRSSRTTWKST
jgi:polar amino acid transport system substrate-binding protein